MGTNGTSISQHVMEIKALFEDNGSFIAGPYLLGFWVDEFSIASVANAERLPKCRWSGVFHLLENHLLVSKLLSTFWEKISSMFVSFNRHIQHGLRSWNEQVGHFGKVAGIWNGYQVIQLIICLYCSTGWDFIELSGLGESYSSTAPEQFNLKDIEILVNKEISTLVQMSSLCNLP